MAFFQYLFILMFKTVLSQFAPHVDLQKLGEIIIKDEKYKVLKPTEHKVTNHFEDETLRRDARDDERMFIDDYGFRHFWKGLENRKHYDGNDNGVENYRNDEDILRRNEKTDVLRIPPPTRGKTARKSVAKPRPKPLSKKSAKAKAKPAPAGAKPPAKAEAAEKPAAKAAAKPPAKAEAEPAANNTLRTVDGVDRDRTVAKTFYFCPFLGVIAIRDFID